VDEGEFTGAASWVRWGLYLGMTWKWVSFGAAYW